VPKCRGDSTHRWVRINENFDKVTDSHIIGALDLVVEVASPSTAIYDRHDKLVAYARAGVPEYWIVDPDARTVEVLILEAPGQYLSQGIFRGKALLPSRTVPNFSARVEQFFK